MNPVILEINGVLSEVGHAHECPTQSGSPATGPRRWGDKSKDLLFWILTRATNLSYIILAPVFADMHSVL